MFCPTFCLVNTHTHKYSLTSTHTFSHTHTHTRTDTHTHTHAQIHTHAFLPDVQGQVCSTVGLWQGGLNKSNLRCRGPLLKRLAAQEKERLCNCSLPLHLTRLYTHRTWTHLASLSHTHTHAHTLRPRHA